MRLITHNMLASPVKGVETSFPLGIELTKVEVKEQEFNADFLKMMLPKLEWKALVEACQTVGSMLEEMPRLPDTLTDELIEDEEFLKQLHTALLEVYVMDGNLICPTTGRKFPITNGIPNMLCSAESSS